MKPGRAVWAVAGALVVLAALGAAGLVPYTVWRLALTVAAAVLVLDLSSVAVFSQVTVERNLATVLPLGVSADVYLALRNRGSRSLSVSVHDHYPPSFVPQGLPQRVRLSAQGERRCTYTVRPTERGDHRFGPVEVWIDSWLHLWQRRQRLGGSHDVRVYPNFRAMHLYTMLAVENRIGRLGIHQRRRRGVGLEFHSLRDYRVGDTANQIDWRASSRRLKLIARQYQDEQDQQIVILLDCGRRMHARDGELAHFDHALNAALLLAHIALRQGDSVGLMTFGGVDRSFAPRRGVGAINALLRATYDILPTLHASDIGQAIEDSASRLPKRSLVVLVSNTQDASPEHLRLASTTLLRRHLLLFASLRETVLDDALHEPIERFDTALRVAATAQYLQRRAAVLRYLQNLGLICLDVTPAALAPALANAYLQLKAERRL